MDLKQAEIKDFEATSMLVVYSDGKNKYLETHEIINGKPQVGKPISIEAVNELRHALGDVNGKTITSFKGTMPINLLYMDSDPLNPILIWFTTKMYRKLYFSKESGVTSKTMNIPNIVWMLKKNVLSVFVCTELPNNKSKIFYAPFPNIHPDDTVCMGNVTIKTDYDNIAAIMKHIENSFWNSEFNTIHHEESCKINIYEFWEHKNDIPNCHQYVKHKVYKNLKQLIYDNQN